METRCADAVAPGLATFLFCRRGSLRIIAAITQEAVMTRILTAGTDEKTMWVHTEERFARLIDEVPPLRFAKAASPYVPGLTLKNHRPATFHDEMIKQSEVLDCCYVTPHMPHQSHDRVDAGFGCSCAHCARDRTEGRGLRLRGRGQSRNIQSQTSAET